MIGYANLQQTYPNYNSYNSYNNNYNSTNNMNMYNNYNSYGTYNNYNTSVYNNYYGIQNMGSSVMAPQMVQQDNSSQMLMQFFSIIIPLLMQFLGKTNSTGKTTVDQTNVTVEDKIPDFGAVTTPARNANANVSGSGQTLLVKDIGGANNNSVTGTDNRVEFIGDADANGFHIGGEDNVVSVYNIGSDDRIYLKGSAEDWETIALPQSETTRNSAHYVIFHNKKTDTYVKAASDERARNENWIKSKISYE